VRNGHLIYQGIAEPLHKDSVSETITIDKWYKDHPNPVLRKALSIAILAGAFFMHPTINFAEDIKVDKWFQPTQQPVLRKVTRQTAGETRFELPRTILLSDWFKQACEPVRNKPRQLLGGEARTEVVSTEVITVDKWWRQISEPYFSKIRQQRYGESRFELPRTIFIDDWNQNIVQPYFSKLRQQRYGESRFEVPRDIFVSDWFLPTEQPRITKVRNVNTGETRTELAIISAEIITLDKWWQITQQPILRKTTRQAAGKFRFETPAQVFDWIQQQSQPVRRLLTRIYTQDYSIVSITVQELVTLDKWFKETNQPRIVKFRDARFGQYFVEVPRNILITDWWQTTQQPIIRKRHSLPVEYMVGNFLVALPVIENEVAMFHSRITTNVNEGSEITDANLSSGMTNVNTGSDIQPDELRLSSRIINRNAL